ncbi:Adenosylhomocysteinase [Stenotrophomonas lactitubi]|nr:Adenosylhomocysteinase [Stenotrophomonas lactitubi]
MKAGIVIMAAALEKVARPGEIAVLLTSDEEVGSTTSRALIERGAARAGTVLVLEPSLDGALKIARRGGSIYRLAITGRAAHAGLEPWKGRSALAELANQVLAQIFLFEQKYADLSPAQKAERLTVEVLPKKLDEEVALEMVRGFGGVVTQLTKTQADYIGVTVEGPFKPHAYRY